MSQWPTILKAAVEIALDNNGIRRDRSEEDHAKQLEDYLHGYARDGRGAELEKAESELAALTEEDFETACAGEFHDMEALVSDGKLSVNTNRLLNCIFEDVC